MPKKSVTAILSALVLFAGISGYVIADINDQVPGFLTRKAAESPAPLPTPNAPTPVPAWPSQMQVDLPAITSAQVKPLWDKLVADANKTQEAQNAQKAQNSKTTPPPTPTSSVRTGAYVIDALTGNVLLSGNGEVPMQPASTTKVLTAFTVEHVLDTQKRLATTTFLGEDGAVHLVGEGDLLLADGAGDDGEVNGHAGVADLAQQTALTLKELKKTPTSLVFHDQIFDGPTREPGLSDDLASWVGNSSAFAVDTGLTPGDSEPGMGDKPFLDRPGEYVAQTLARHLADAGVNLTVTPGSGQFNAAKAEKLGQVESATIAQVTRLMMRTSDNTLAEQLCRLAAREAKVTSDFAGSTKHVADTVSGAGVNVEKLVLNDCSGLNEGNLIAPRTTAQTLLQVWRTQPGMMRDLPYAWFSGTLNTRFVESAQAPWVAAKTGSLDESASLAGYATTKSGRVLVFQVQVDTAKDGAWAYRPVLDAFASGLTELP